MGYQTVKSVIKALALLELLMDRTLENKSLALGDAARSLGIPSATARSLLRTLEECGYVRRSGHGQYEEGERCYRVFHVGGILRKLREIATPVIEQASRELGESLLLTSVINGKRVELLRLQASDDRLVNPQWHAEAEFYTMRTTRVMLAWFAPEQLAFFVERNGLPTLQEWPECENSPEGMRRELRNIRRLGGICDQQGGYAAIAVPILSPGKEAIASIGCYAPLERTDKARAAGLFKLLQDCAAAIGEQLY